MTVLPEVGRSGFSKNHFEFPGKPIRSISRSQSLLTHNIGREIAFYRNSYEQSRLNSCWLTIYHW